MKITNWTDVTASQNDFKKLPAGGYVVVITDVTDVEAKEYLEIEWDIAEGEYKGYFSDEWGRNNTYAHTFRTSYKDSARGLFKRFLDCIERSNPSFNTAQWQTQSNPKAFIGKVFGASWGTEKYTNQNGENRERMTFPMYWTVDEIRSGNFKCPKDKDTRTNQSNSSNIEGYTTSTTTMTSTTSTNTTVYDEDLPF